VSGRSCQGRGEVGRRGVRKLVVLSTTAAAAVAFAAPARAEDPSPPPPVMLAKSAVIVPDEPNDTAAVEVTVPSVAPPATDQVPRTTASFGWKIAAKARPSRHVAQVRPTLRTVQRSEPAVISTPRAPVTPVRRHHVAKRARTASVSHSPTWYQVARAQYRQVESRARVRAESAVYVAAAEPAQDARVTARNELPTTRSICNVRLPKCLELCAPDDAYNVSWNGHWIATCIGAPPAASALDKFHALLLQRLRTLAVSAGATRSGLQYQCLTAQYQAAACGDSASQPQAVGGASAVGWQLARAERGGVAKQPRAVRALPVAASPPRHRRHVLAAVAVARQTETQRVGREAVRPAATARRVDRSPEALAPAGPAGASGDWLLRSVFVLMGLAALLALLVLALEADALAGLRSRLGSRGLSASRIALPSGERRPGDRSTRIRYRD
jgi:hypothetical protein